jgi:hypothetical protein
MAARMKVFCWSDGFNAYTVAATSRPKALAAWGFNRDLFKDGEAKEVGAGAKDATRALAEPGQVIRRGLRVNAGQVAAIKPPTPRRRRGPTAADRARVAKLERELEALDAAWAREAARMERERAALQDRAERAEQRFKARRQALERRLAAARDGA